MTRQYNEGMPGLTSSGGKTFFDLSHPGFDGDLLKFYEDYLGALGTARMAREHRFGISPGHARGFHALLSLLDTTGCPYEMLKGQITGPITLATSLTDQQGRAAYYDERLRELIVKTLSLKARWQIHQLAPYGVPVIIFLDEPSLAAYGSSACLGIAAEDVRADLQEIIALIHGEGGFAGVHCCENTDWGILLRTDIDILSFDAYGFFDRVILYGDDLKRFVNRGGVLAWGLIPTDSADSVRRETAPLLIDRWEGYAKTLMTHGFERERLLAQSLITPSCGTGSLPVESSEQVMALLKDVSEGLQEKQQGE
jgi:hypothetical protein